MHEPESLDVLPEGRSLPKETKEVRPVSDEHIEAVLKQVSPLVADVCRFMRSTGCRPAKLSP